MEKPHQFDERLLLYSVAAGAVLLGAGGARADVIPVITNVTLDTDGDVFNVEFEGSTKFTIEFAAVSNTYTSDGSTYTSYGYWVDVVAQTAGASWRGGSGYGVFGPSALDYGDPVKDGPTANWARRTSATGNMAYYYTYYSGGSGNFFGRTNKFLGLRFIIGGHTNYGWVEIAEVPDDVSFVTIAGYAYETAPDTEILAGLVPEPNALGLLALGAAGVTAMRRRAAARA